MPAGWFRRGKKLFDPFLWDKPNPLNSLHLDVMLGNTRRPVGENLLGDIPMSMRPGGRSPDVLSLPPLGPRQAVNLEREVPEGFGPQFTSAREIGRRVPAEGAVGPEVDRFRRGNIKALDTPGWSLEWNRRVPEYVSPDELFTLTGPKGDRWALQMFDPDASGTWDVSIGAASSNTRGASISIGVIRQVMREVARVVPGIVAFRNVKPDAGGVAGRIMKGPLYRRMEETWKYPKEPPPGFRPRPRPDMGPPPFGQGGYAR